AVVDGEFTFTLCNVVYRLDPLRARGCPDAEQRWIARCYIAAQIRHGQRYACPSGLVNLRRRDQNRAGCSSSERRYADGCVDGLCNDNRTHSAGSLCGDLQLLRRTSDDCRKGACRCSGWRTLPEYWRDIVQAGNARCDYILRGRGSVQPLENT